VERSQPKAGDKRNVQERLHPTPEIAPSKFGEIVRHLKYGRTWSHHSWTRRPQQWTSNSTTWQRQLEHRRVII